MRVTALCPEGLIDDANCLAMVWGAGPDDARTFRNARWVDESGHVYSVASWEADDTWRDVVGGAANTSDLEALRPGWDRDATIDMSAAMRAQAALVFWKPDEPASPPPPAEPGRLLLVAGLGGGEALAVLGLFRRATP